MSSSLHPSEILYRYLDSGGVIPYISGPCVGKTTWVKKFLTDRKEILFAYVNCLLLTSPLELYNDIFTKFISELPCKQRTKFAKKLTSVGDFRKFFVKFLPLARERDYKIICIVFDEIEAQEHETLTESLSLLSTVRNLNLILISRTTISEFIDIFKCSTRCGQIESRIAIIDIPPLNVELMIELICKERPSHHDDIYDMYVNYVVNLLYHEKTIDLIEMRNFCQANFGKFIQEYDSTPKTEVSKNIMNAFLRSFVASITEQNQENNSWIDKKVHLSMGMLIVAAYIAAHTGPAHDKQNFVMDQPKRFTRARNAYFKISGQFTQERLKQIHKFLMKMTDNDSTWESDKVLKDIKILEDLGMIIMTYGDSLDSLARYKISNHITRTHYETLLKNYCIEREIHGLQVE